MTVRIFLILAALVLFLNGSHAYERATHEDMSEAAAFSSMLAKPETLSTLGLSGGINDPKLTFPNSEGKDKTIRLLIRDGANFEDNLILGSLLRVRHHFYDPLYDRPLTVAGVAIGEKSPDWALEDLKDIGSQAFSFRHARDSLYKALTLSDEQERKKNFGLTFQSLGHVVHHIQDMVQPQHVRNDIHPSIGSHKSLYEEYTESKGGNLPFNTYPPVNAITDTNFLTTGRSFWHTQNKNPVAGLGIAEFTSANFLSAGTNFDTTAYPSPKLGDATPWDDNANSLFEREGLTVPPECLPPNQPCVMTFYRSRVQDNYRSAASEDNDYTSTVSIFDQDLQAQNKRAFSLNRFNFNAAHEFLIPRAVAYSAGLIDYFFRGKLSAEDVTFTDTGISLRVKNAIDPQKTPAWQNEVLYAKNSNGSAGSLTVAFDYQDSAGKTQYGVSNTVPMRATDTLAPGQVSADVYGFTLSVPPDAKDVNYRLIFRGKLGQEDDAVAVGVVEPISGFLVTPNYLPADGISGPRAIFKQGGQWRLSDKEGLQAGNIDWKGWYVNGKPTKVLSWGGPELRYFHDARYENFRREIFENGEIFDSAPAPVLGAAITKDHAGVEWVVAIVKEEFEDVAYRRLHAKNDPPDPREQWQEVGRFNAAANDGTNEMTDEARTPWFFSGDGKEAQHMRIWGRDTDVPRMTRFKRLKMMLNTTVDTAEFSDRGNLPGFQLSESCSGGYDSGGRGTITVTGRSEGEYIVAVDYKNDTELLAKIRLDSPSSAVYVDSGSTIVHQYSWKEYIDWGAGEILYFDSSRKAEGSTSVQNQEAFFRWRQHLYGFDLRHDLYAYTYYQDKKNARVESMGPFVPPMRFGIAELIEGGQIDRQGYPSVIIYGPVTSESTDPDLSLIQSPTQCGSDYLTTRYGTLTFGTYSRLGGAYAAVDTNDNLVASFGYIDFDNRAHVFSHLSEGVLAELIPGAPPIPEYAPIGVLR